MRGDIPSKTRDKNKQKRLGYREWRQREIEKLIMHSGAADRDKLAMLMELHHNRPLSQPMVIKDMRGI